MKRPDIDAIEARVSAASEPPWEAEHSQGRDTQWFDVCVGDEVLLSAETEPKLHVVHVDDKQRISQAVEQHIADIEFVAHARTDVPGLIAYIRHLEAKLNEVKSS